MTRITERHFTRPDGTIDEARRVQAVARLGETSPMLRVGEAEEVAPTALYLLSDASLFVTGQVLRVNGGSVMG
jgi:3-oxoacyl-[acyl-carrier protein] reductase